MRKREKKKSLYITTLTRRNTNKNYMEMYILLTTSKESSLVLTDAGLLSIYNEKMLNLKI